MYPAISGQMQFLLKVKKNVCLVIGAWVCEHVCVHVCMRACMRACVYAQVFAHLYLHMCVYECMQIHAFVSVHMCVHTQHMHMCACVCICTKKCEYRREHKHTSVCVCVCYIGGHIYISLSCLCMCSQVYKLVHTSMSVCVRATVQDIQNVQGRLPVTISYFFIVLGAGSAGGGGGGGGGGGFGQLLHRCCCCRFRRWRGWGFLIWRRVRLNGTMQCIETLVDFQCLPWRQKDSQRQKGRKIHKDKSCFPINHAEA